MRAVEHGRFACTHCQSSFLYTGARVVPPPHVARTPDSGGLLVVIVSIVLMVFAGAVFFLYYAAGEVVGHTVTSPPTVEVAPRASAPVAIPERAVPVMAARPPDTATPRATPQAPSPQTPPPQVEADRAPPQLSDYQVLTGCGCAKDKVQFLVLSNGRTTTISNAGLTVTRNLEFAVLAADRTLWRMPTTETSAPASAYDKGDISMGVGCQDDTLVVAAGMGVSAWSLTKHTLLWSHTLAAPFGKYGTGDGSTMGIDCDTLRPGKDSISVRAGKRSVKLALADGTVR